MKAEEIIKFIKDAKKKTPVKVYLKAEKNIEFENCQVFGAADKVIFGDWEDIGRIINENRDYILDMVVENDCRNSAVPLLDLKAVNARIEPGAVIRDQVEIGDGAVIMMGAVINIGAVIGSGTMIDMGAILGGRATVGKNSHIGAGAVLAGVVEPPSAKPVVIGDDVLVGANAVVLEGVSVGSGSVVAAGAVVIEDVPEGSVVAGIPAKVIKSVKDTEAGKIAIVQALREL
ncbi:2,3,4,5-tetrahydropyridine-2,6-dicarboxylate N-acetyltransferase [Clostridia bacterium]|nr:2,3,4,5-tetrahydropyridine-2,6-dicarboxylate N-acetyltransferase [Clostridia bacterium]